MPRENDVTTPTVRLPASDIKKERERRRALGIYYTPAPAAEVLARWVIQRADQTVLEPSFGGCSMLSAAVSVFRALGNENPSSQLYGYDVDAKAFEYLAQVGIDNTARQFKKSDFLRSQAGDIKVSSVLANPPFVSHHRLSSAQRLVAEKIRQLYFPKLPKLASLWAYFVLHSMSFLLAGGRMAFVLPNAIGTTDYGKELLRHLGTRFEKVELIHVGERIFVQAGAGERIALLLLSGYCPDTPDMATPVEVRYVTRVSEIEVGASLDPEANSNSPMDLRAASNAALDKLVGNSLIKLGDVATVQIGEVVGNIPFFVKTKPEWRVLDIDARHLFPLLTRTAQLSGLSLRDEDISARHSAIPRLLLPSVRRLSEKLSAYLETYGQAAVDANRTFEKRTTWYRCSYDTTADAFIGSLNHEYPRVIGNEAGISCSNSFYKIKFTDLSDFGVWLPLLSLSTPFRLAGEVLARIRGSGGFKLEPSDVRRLVLPSRLPALSDVDFAELRTKVDLLISDNKLDAAGQLVDGVVFLETGLIDAEQMAAMRQNQLSLTLARMTRH